MMAKHEKRKEKKPKTISERILIHNLIGRREKTELKMKESRRNKYYESIQLSQSCYLAGAEG
jgi:hypothetical protein